MKYKGLFAIAALAPLTFLCACGGTVSNLSFNANWYRNTSLKDDLAATNEELKYAVTFQEEERHGFTLSYTDGVYSTKLTNGKVELDGGSQEGYHYTTDLTVKVQYSLNGKKSEIFEDHVHSEVHFLSPANGLKPVKSVKEVYCHAPLTDRPATLEKSFAEYDFSYTIEYDDNVTEAFVDYQDKRQPSNSEQKTYSLKGAGTFLDNEQLLFAFRGLDLSIPVSLRSFNLVQNKVQQISLSTLEQTEAKVDFTADEEPVQKEDFAVNAVAIHYGGDGAGQPQTLIYAKTTDHSSNLYRNVLVEMQVPVYFSLGTFTYRLTTATFAKK